MTDALSAIHRAARYGRIVPTAHARERMDERGAQARDVKKAILTATTALDQGDGSYRLEGGCDLDGDALVVVVREIQPGLLVITIF